MQLAFYEISVFNSLVMVHTLQTHGFKTMHFHQTTENVAFLKLFIFELFCLQSSLIVGMQPQVSGKVGWLVGWTMFGIPDDCRILPKGWLSGPKQKCRVDRKEKSTTKATRRVPRF